MGNLNYKAELLLRQYLIRKENEKNTVTVYNYGSSWINNKDSYDGVIYFYEWSDVNRCPQLFYTIGAFDTFLKRSNIFIPPFQLDIIRKLDRAYITCKKGTHNLLIRGSRELLVEASKDDNAKGVETNIELPRINSLPVPATTFYGGVNNLINNERKPPMYNGFPDEWYC